MACQPFDPKAELSRDGVRRGAAFVYREQDRLREQLAAQAHRYRDGFVQPDDHQLTAGCGYREAIGLRVRTPAPPLGPLHIDRADRPQRNLKFLVQAPPHEQNVASQNVRAHFAGQTHRGCQHRGVHEDDPEDEPGNAGG